MPFTGIVEEIGTITSYEESAELTLWDGSKGSGVVIGVECNVVSTDASMGCSIAVNGTCLTVTKFTPTSFEVNVSPETLRLTNIGKLSKGSRVNLERAMAADGRNSGHVVQGHVDCVGTVESKRPDGEALWVVVAVPTTIFKYIVKKGYIAIDGTSLTVCHVDKAASTLSVMLVAHTQSCVILPHKEKGDAVNIEVDVISKYVEASMSARLEALEAAVFGNNGGDSTKPPPPGPVPTQNAPTTTPSKEEEDIEMKEIKGQLKVTDNKHGAALQINQPSKETASKLKIGIVKTAWHGELIDLMESKCLAALVNGGVEKNNIYRTKVSGSFELPFVAQRLIETQEVDCVIVIGILLKGGTIHMEVIANAVTKSLLDVQSKFSIPIVFGVLTVFSLEQAQERAESDLGTSWGQAALSQAVWTAENTDGLITKGF